MNKGCCAMFSIHAPPSVLFHQFDRILLLTKWGDAAYCGPRSRVIAHFANLGHRCPKGCNPCEFLMDLVMTLDDVEVVRLVDAFRHSDVASDERELINELHRQERVIPDSRIGTARKDVERGADFFLTPFKKAAARFSSDAADRVQIQASYLTQFRHLNVRNAASVFRRYQVLLINYGATTLLALAMLVAFPHLNMGQQQSLNSVLERVGFFFFVLSFFFMMAMSIVGMWREERLIYLRDRDAQCYGPAVYVLSKVLWDILPLRVLPPVIFTLITYFSWGVNLRQCINTQTPQPKKYSVSFEGEDFCTSAPVDYLKAHREGKTPMVQCRMNAPGFCYNEYLIRQKSSSLWVDAVTSNITAYYAANGYNPIYVVNFLASLVLANLGAVTIFFAVSVATSRVATANLVCTLVTLYNMLMCGALAQKISLPNPSVKWLFNVAVLNYAYEAMPVHILQNTLLQIGRAALLMYCPDPHSSAAVLCGSMTG